MSARYECEDCGLVAWAGHDDDGDFDALVEDHELQHAVEAPLIVQAGHAAECDCAGCCSRRATATTEHVWSSVAGIAAIADALNT